MCLGPPQVPVGSPLTLAGSPRPVLGAFELLGGWGWLMSNKLWLVLHWTEASSGGGQGGNRGVMAVPPPPSPGV